MLRVKRWGILGGAWIARSAVAPAIVRSEHADLVAIATNSETHAEHFRLLQPNLTIHADYGSLLADDDIDCVYIPLPNTLHVYWTIAALESGKHVLCEKPMAMHASDFDLLENASRKAGRHLAEALMVLHHPQWGRVKELLDAGVIGELRCIDCVFTFANSDVGNIRNRPETGGGALRDLGIYPIAVTRFVTGQEAADGIESCADVSIFEGGVDVLSDATVKFSRFSLNFRVGLRLSSRQEMVFHGTEGWLRLNAPFNPGTYGAAQIEVRRQPGQLSVEDINGPDQYQLMIETFMLEACGEKKPLVSLQYSHDNQEILDRLIAVRREV